MIRQRLQVQFLLVIAMQFKEIIALPLHVQILCVAGLELAMQHLLKSCRNIENSENLGSSSISKFAIALCRLDAIFLRDGNAIVSENTLQLQANNCSCSRSFNTDYVSNMFQTLSFDYRSCIESKFCFLIFLGIPEHSRVLNA